MSRESEDYVLKPDTEVVIIDDDEPITELVEIVLSGEGYKVQAINDSLVALGAVKRLRLVEQIAQINFIVLLDFFMPGMDGMTLGNEILKYYPKARLVMCTAADYNPELRGFIDDHQCDYLPKPFGLDDLFTVVRRNREFLQQ